MQMNMDTFISQLDSEGYCDITDKQVEALIRGYAELEAQVKQLAAELSAVDAVHNEAVFITDDDYDKCPKRVQDIIRHLAVMQIPAYQSFVASLRAEAIEFAAYHLPSNGKYEDMILTLADEVREGLTEVKIPAPKYQSSQSEQVKGVQS